MLCVVSISAKPNLAQLSSIGKDIQEKLPNSITIRWKPKKTQIKLEKTNTDSNSPILLQTASSVLMETFALVSILAVSHAIPILQDFPAIPLLFIIFASSAIQRLINGGIVSVASNQIQKPTTIPGDASWYTQLKKPFFNPPGWMFPIMWLVVCKPTQLLATVTLMQMKSIPWLSLTVFCTHLALGDAWNYVFFGRQKIGLGAVLISIFYAMLLLSTALFYNVDPNAGKLLLPTCAWVTVATALNFEIYRLNKK